MIRLAHRWLTLPFVAGLVGCGGGDSVTAPPTSTLEMDPAAWTMRYSPGMPEHPTAALGGGWQFDFPGADGVHYLTTPLTANLLASHAISVSLQVIGTDAVFAWTPDICAGSASARVMVERQGDDLRSPSGRWWTVAPIVLKAGATVVSAPITPDQWSNVNGVLGTDDPQGFADAMSHTGFVGLTFGGGCFFGHGVWLSAGAARMIVKDFSIL